MVFPDPLDALADHFTEHGYVVARGAVAPEACQRLVDAFQLEVKPFRGRAYRQTTATPDHNVFTPEGHLANPLLDLATLPRRRLPTFYDETWRVLGEPRLGRLVGRLLGDPGGGTVVQTFFFEANPVTPPHHDAYYLDGRLRAEMLGAWVALEDIAPNAGRFYVCPDSHGLDLPTNAGEYEVHAHHDAYQARIRALLATMPRPCCAPALRRGDVLVWSGRTIHGSLPSAPGLTRLSLNAHFIPRGATIAPVPPRRIQLRDTFRPVDFRTIGTVHVHRPVGLSRLRVHAPTTVRAILRDHRARRAPR